MAALEVVSVSGTAIDSFPRRQDVGYRWHHKYTKIGVESWLTITSHGKPS